MKFRVMISPRFLLGALATLVAVAPVAVAPVAVNAFTIPEGIHRYPQLKEASLKAYEEEKPLLILYTYPKVKPS